ncbi:MAG TPA: hypothetical protein VMV09_04590 [Candidatus Saccharimonadales bacterium]|nr:hypothetical protein [Candidatus Saccharimonadales bacterium]
MARRNRAHRVAAQTGAAIATPRPAGQVNATGANPVESIRAWAPTAARVSLGLVLLWFGMHELTQPGQWTGYVPIISQTSHLALALVLIHGWLLSLLGLALTLGVAAQLAAAVSALMLLEIVVALSFTGGVSDIVARDLGVFGLAVAVFSSDRQKLVLRS